MARQITVSDVSGLTLPVNIYVCDVTNTTCEYFGCQTTFPYTFTVNSTLADGDFLVKLIDCLNCEVIRYFYQNPELSTTPTLTPTNTTTPTVTSSPNNTATPTATPLVSQTRTPFMTPFVACEPTATPPATATPTPTEPGTVIVTVEVGFFSGSIGAGYVVYTTTPVDQDIIVNFVNQLYYQSGGSFTISGQTTIVTGTDRAYFNTMDNSVDYNSIVKDAVFFDIILSNTAGSRYAYSTRGVFFFDVTPTPTITASQSPTPTLSISPTNTPSISVSPTLTPSISITPTNTPSRSINPTQTVTPTITRTPVVGYTCPATVPGPSSANVRVATAADAITYPNVNQGDLLVLGPNRTDAGLPAIFLTEAQTSVLGPGKKIVIRGSSYGLIYIPSFASGTTENPIIITNFCGQVHCRKLSIKGLAYFKITGKYDPIGRTGDPAYIGHDGGYAWSQGTYGIFIDNQWTSSAATLLQIEGLSGTGKYHSATNYEVEYIESGNGGYTNQAIDTNYQIVEGIKIHDCYFHDISGEGIYWGYVRGVDTFEIYQGIQIYNNRFIRTGWDGIQVKRMIGGSRIYNNAVVSTGLSNSSGQNMGMNISFLTGPATVDNNLVWNNQGYAGFNFFYDDEVPYPPTGGTVTLQNNAVLYIGIADPATHGSEQYSGARGLFLRNPTYGVLYEPTETSIDNNYFGYFLSPNSGTDVVENGMRNSATSPIYFTNNTYDNTGDIVRFIGGTNFTTNTNNTQTTTLNDAQFVNYYIGPSFDPHRFARWRTPDPYDVGWYVTNRSKIYKALGPSSNIEPGVTAGWETYWEEQVYTTPTGTSQYPADDVRLVAGSYFSNRGIGLLDNP